MGKQFQINEILHHVGVKIAGLDKYRVTIYFTDALPLHFPNQTHTRCGRKVMSLAMLCMSHRTHEHILLILFMRLFQPRGSCSCIYFSQEQGSPVIKETGQENASQAE
jgi:hypothetical protein